MTRQMIKYIIAMAIVPVVFGAGRAEGGALGYWRFEDTPGFLNDSSGNGLANSGAGSQALIAATDFSTTIPQTGDSNAEVLSFTGSSAPPPAASRWLWVLTPRCESRSAERLRFQRRASWRPATRSDS